MTLCFLVQEAYWERVKLCRHPVSGFYAAFQNWGRTNPVARDVNENIFDRHLRQFLQATALSYTVNTETGFVTQVEGLRLQPRTAREQEMALVSLARLDYPAF